MVTGDIWGKPKTPLENSSPWLRCTELPGSVGTLTNRRVERFESSSACNYKRRHMFRRKTSNSNRHKTYYSSGKSVNRLLNIIEDIEQRNGNTAKNALNKNRELNAKEFKEKEKD